MLSTCFCYEPLFLSRLSKGMDTTLRHEDDGKKGGFYMLDEAGNRLAEMTYSHRSESVININHTEVDERLQGQGIAKKLLDATIAMARKNSLNVKATCSYAHGQLTKHADQYADILA